MRWVLLALLLIPVASWAGDWYMTVPFASYHFNRNQQHCEKNLGLGVEYATSDTFRYIAGGYKNSLCAASLYGGGVWTPWSPASFIKFGLVGAGVTGYEKPAALVAPLVKLHERNNELNLIILPKNSHTDGVVGFQFVRRF